MIRVIFVGNARCYHTMDWYRSVKRQMSKGEAIFATDLIDSEGHRVLVQPNDDVVSLFNIDWALFRTQSKIGGAWRNLVKLLFIPLQALALRRITGRHRAATFHAHTMYYMVVCMVAGVRCIGTPQGSEILVRPRRSALYRYFAVKALKSAVIVTVDSVAMRDKVKEISGVTADVVQNGIDVTGLSRIASESPERYAVVSIRGMTPLYRIHEILRAREESELPVPMSFIYPFWDEAYRDVARTLMHGDDQDLGRLEKAAMFGLLARALMVVSIPESDSSPRSVYEAIFAGAIVASTYGAWMDALPECMRGRIVLVDLSDREWFAKALGQAKRFSEQAYRPSEAAHEMFDEERLMGGVIKRYYLEAT